MLVLHETNRLHAIKHVFFCYRHPSMLVFFPCISVQRWILEMENETVASGPLFCRDATILRVSHVAVVSFY